MFSSLLSIITVSTKLFEIIWKIIQLSEEKQPKQKKTDSNNGDKKEEEEDEEESKSTYNVDLGQIFLNHYVCKFLCSLSKMFLFALQTRKEGGW